MAGPKIEQLLREMPAKERKTHPRGSSQECCLSDCGRSTHVGFHRHHAGDN